MRTKRAYPYTQTVRHHTYLRPRSELKSRYSLDTGRRIRVRSVTVSLFSLFPRYKENVLYFLAYNHKVSIQQYAYFAKDFNIVIP